MLSSASCAGSSAAARSHSPSASTASGNSLGWRPWTRSDPWARPEPPRAGPCSLSRTSTVAPRSARAAAVAAPVMPLPTTTTSAVPNDDNVAPPLPAPRAEAAQPVVVDGDPESGPGRHRDRRVHDLDLLDG